MITEFWAPDSRTAKVHGEEKAQMNLQCPKKPKVSHPERGGQSKGGENY